MIKIEGDTMRLHKCRKVENYLSENNLIDERLIWCYAQVKACVSSRNVYGLALVCVKGEELFIYNTEYNSTALELIYSCNICDMKNIGIKRKLFATRLSFTNTEDSFVLDMDDWKRFFRVFEGEVRCNI